MTYTYSILFADNVPEQVAPKIELLKSFGYRVFPANTVEEAQKIMEGEHIHLAILDIRLCDENDPLDVSGIVMAKESQYRAIPKIIYTGYPTLETMREVLWFPLKGMPVAVDYITKSSSTDRFLKFVRNTIQDRVHINEDLKIDHLKEAASIDSLVNDLEAGLERAHRSARIEEMEDLFRSAFYDYQYVTISNVFWILDGRFTLEVLASKDGGEERFIVTAGKTSTIMKEIEIYQKSVPKSSKTSVLASFITAEGVHYALRAFPVAPGEAPSEEILTLYRFFQTHSASQTREVLGDLFSKTLSLWRQRKPGIKDIAIEKYYRQSLHIPQINEQELVMNRFCHLAENCMIHNIAEFSMGPEHWDVRVQKSPRINLDNPLALVYSDSEPFRTRFNLCAGSLNIETVLVNQNRQVYLTDYAAVREAPIWEDFVTLEYSARMMNPRSDFQTLLNQEKSLLALNRLGEVTSLDDLDGETKKMASFIQMIRQEAANLNEFGLKEYLTALYFYTLRDLLTYTGDSALPTPYLKMYAYKLAMAGMIAKKVSGLSQKHLLPAADPEEEVVLSILDPVARQVLVGQRVASLSQQEFPLFQYLFDRAGKICSRKDIFSEVYKIKQPSDNDESTLTQNIRRIRVRIEANPDNPVFLTTIRGVGFKLIVRQP